MWGRRGQQEWFKHFNFNENLNFILQIGTETSVISIQPSVIPENLYCVSFSSQGLHFQQLCTNYQVRVGHQLSTKLGPDTNRVPSQSRTPTVHPVRAGHQLSTLSGPDTNCLPSQGQTPTFYQVRAGHQLSTQSGPDINCLPSQGQTPTVYPVRARHQLSHQSGPDSI